MLGSLSWIFLDFQKHRTSEVSSKYFRGFSLYLFNTPWRVWSILMNRGVRLQPYSILAVEKGTALDSRYIHWWETKCLSNANGHSTFDLNGKPTRIPGEWYSYIYHAADCQFWIKPHLSNVIEDTDVRHNLNYNYDQGSTCHFFDTFGQNYNCILTTGWL